MARTSGNPACEEASVLKSYQLYYRMPAKYTRHKVPTDELFVHLKIR
jgi:hypothetical protein